MIVILAFLIILYSKIRCHFDGGTRRNLIHDANEFVWCIRFLFRTLLRPAHAQSK
jgi:hypothetical protein